MKEKIYLRKMRADEKAQAVALLANGFSNDPLYKYFFSNEKHRLEKSKWLFGFEVIRCFDYIYVGEDFSVIAIVKTHNDKAQRVPLVYVVKLFFNVGLFSTYRAIKYIVFSEKLKKENIKSASSYLSILCVSPAFRGKGLAGKVINSFANNTIYLETQNPLNVKTHQKYGFKLIGKKKFSKDVCHYMLEK